MIIALSTFAFAKIETPIDYEGVNFAANLKTYESYKTYKHYDKTSGATIILYEIVSGVDGYMNGTFVYVLRKNRTGKTLWNSNLNLVAIKKLVWTKDGAILVAEEEYLDDNNYAQKSEVKYKLTLAPKNELIVDKYPLKKQR